MINAISGEIAGKSRRLPRSQNIIPPCVSHYGKRRLDPVKPSSRHGKCCFPSSIQLGSSSNFHNICFGKKRLNVPLYKVIQKVLFLRADVHFWSNRWQHFTEVWSFWKYGYNWAILVMEIRRVTKGRFWKYMESTKITLKALKFYL